MGGNHLFFYRYAIDACLDDERWDQAAGYARALERFTEQEPLPVTAFLGARAQALARHGQGVRSEELRGELSRLAGRAAELRMRVARRAIEDALATYRR
jgi:hypothetical protein